MLKLKVLVYLKQESNNQINQHTVLAEEASLLICIILC